MKHPQTSSYLLKKRTTTKGHLTAIFQFQKEKERQNISEFWPNISIITEGSFCAYNPYVGWLSKHNYLCSCFVIPVILLRILMRISAPLVLVIELIKERPHWMVLHKPEAAHQPWRTHQGLKSQSCWINSSLEEKTLKQQTGTSLWTFTIAHQSKIKELKAINNETTSPVNCPSDFEAIAAP